MDRASVLIVDNNIRDINEIEALLSGSTIELVKASSSKEAIDLTNSMDLAMVLIEIKPDMTAGFEIAEAIRRNTNQEHLNILYITDNCCETYYGNDYLFTGAVDFIARPLDRKSVV